MTRGQRQDAAAGCRQASTVTPWLQPKERLLTAFDVRLNFLIRNRVPRRYRRAEPEPEKKTGLLWWVLAVVGMGVFWVFNIGLIVCESLSACLLSVLRLLVLPIRGWPFKGGWRSQAGRFVIAVRTGPSYFRNFDNSTALMVLTNRRVLLLHRGVKRNEFLAEFPREQLRRAVDRHQWYSDRVDLHFADESLVAVGLGESDRTALLSALNC